MQPTRLEHWDALEPRTQEAKAYILHLLHLGVGCGLDRFDHLLTIAMVKPETKRDAAFAGC